MKSNLKITIILVLITLGIIFAFIPMITTNLRFITGNINEISDYKDGSNLNNDNMKASKVSAPIYIDDNNPNYNWANTKDSGICTGNGTYSEPYIIEDLVIDGGGLESCIWIKDSNVYFKIENCTLFNSGESYNDAGIRLEYVNNGQLIDNNCSSSYNGIYFSNSNNISISGNTVNKNIWGMYLTYGNFNNISGNIANSNICHGMYLGHNNFNNISGNIACNNTCDGISLWASENNIISGNIAINNTYNGIHLDAGENNTISGNIMNGSGLGLQGWNIEELDSHIIDTTNLVNGKPLYYYTNEVNLGPTDFTNAGQVILVNCNDSLITNLIISHTPYIISLYFCKNNTISENTATNNNYGIYLYFSNNNSISGNNVTNNNYHGIFLYFSNNNSILGNAANDNIVGILLDESYNNIVSGNTANNNKVGILLDGSYYNVILGNNANNNNYTGIYLGSSSFNNISGNTANNNCKGIHLQGSDYNMVSGNVLMGNDECIVEEMGCEGNVFKNNNCGEGGRFPIELIILISIISGGAVIGIATILLIRHKRLIRA